MPIFGKDLIDLAATAGKDTDNANFIAIERFRTASPVEVFNAYGDEGLAEQKLINETFYNIRNSEDTRSGSRRAVDAGLSALGAAVNFGSSLAAGGEYVANRGVQGATGANFENVYPVSNTLDGLASVINAFKSTESERLEGLGELEYVIKQAQRDPELNFISRVGGQIADYASTAANNPAVLDQILGEAVGSLGGIAAGVKGGTAAISKITGKAATTRQQALLAAALEGTGEGSRLSKETYNTIVNTDLAELEKNSPYFNKLVKAGQSAEDARLLTARAAADQTAITGTAASASLALINPFAETKLFQRGAGGADAGSIARNALGEGLEETFQESAQTLLGNLAERQYLDENTDLAKDVGKSAVQGAIGGVGASLGVGIPNIAAATVNTAELVAAGALTGTAELIEDTAPAIKAGVKVAKPVVKKAAEVAKPIVDGIKDSVLDKVETAAEKKEGKNADVPAEAVRKAADKNFVNEANALYKESREVRNALRSPTKANLDKLRSSNRSRLSEVSGGLKEVADRIKVYQADNTGSTKPDIIALLERNNAFLNNAHTQQFLSADKVLNRESTSGTPLGKALNNAIQAFSNLRGTDSAKRVNENIILSGFDYEDQRTGEKIHLPSLVSLVEALEIGNKTKSRNTVLDGKVVAIADVVDQFGILEDNFARKAEAAIKSVELGGQSVKFSASGLPITIRNNDDKSRQFGETVVSEANAIRSILNAYRKGKKAGTDNTFYKLPKEVATPTKEKKDVKTQQKQEVQEVPAKQQTEAPKKPETETEVSESTGKQEERTSPQETEPTTNVAETADSRSDSGGESEVSPQQFNQDELSLPEQKAVKEFTQNRDSLKDTLEQVFKDNAPDFFGNIYRGTGDHDFLEGKKVGEVLTIDRTTSFSKDKEIGKAYTFYPSEERVQPVKRQATFITIVNPGGYDISEISTIKREQEVIIAPGSKFLITKVEQKGKVLHVTLDGNVGVEQDSNPGQTSNVVLDTPKEPTTPTSVLGDAVVKAVQGETVGLTETFTDSLTARLPVLAETGKSILQGIYKFVRDPISADEVKNTLGTGKDISAEVSAEILTRLFGGDTAPGLVKGLSDKMNASLKNNTKINRDKNSPNFNKKYSPLKRFFNNIDGAYTYGGYGSFYFVEKLETDKGVDYQYLPSVLEAITIGSFDWVMNSVHRPITKQKAISRILGIEEHQVTLQHVEAIKYGITRKAAIKGLARNIKGYLNLKDIDTTDIVLINKAVGDLASEVYHNLVELKLIEEKAFDKAIKGKDLHMVQVQNKGTKDIVSGIGANNLRTFSKLFNSQYEENTYSVGQKIPDSFIPQYQQGTGEDLTKEERAAIKIANDKPYYFNIDLFRMVSRLEGGTLRTLLGYVPVSKASNETHRVNIEGKNITIETHIAYLRDMANEVKQYQEYLKSIGVERAIEDIPVHFAHRVIKSGRITQASPGPINTKLIRELVTGKPTTLNLSKEIDQKAFWLSIASGLEIKIKKIPHENLLENLKDVAVSKVNEKFSGTVEVIQELLNSDAIDNKEILSRISKAMVKELGRESTFREVHTLYSYAKYLKAEKDGGLEAFSHSLYTEVDGVTNGAVNTLLYWLGSVGQNVKSFDLKGTVDKMRTLLGAGGIFIPELGNNFVSLNEYAGKDFYELIAEAVSEFANNSKDEGLQAMNRILYNLDIVSYDDETGEYEYGRSFAKGPLTEITYGAGATSIRQSIGGNITKELYAAMNRTAEGKEGFWYDGLQEDMDIVFGETSEYDLDAGKLFGKPGGNKEDNAEYARTFRFKEGDLLSLDIHLGGFDKAYDIAQGASSGVGSSVYGQAIALLGNVKNSTKAILQGYTLQAEAAEIYLNATLDETKEANGFLTKADIKRIVDETVDKFGLAVKTPYGNFNPAKKLVNATTSKISNQAETFQVTTDTVGLDPEVGVSILPLLVIGLGDAFVVKDYLNKSGKGIAQYYDAFDIPTDSNMFAESRSINESMFKAMTTVNLPGYALEGYEVAYNTGLLKPSQGADPDVVLETLKNLSGATSVMQTALKKLNIRVHHYNSGFEEGSFVNEGSGEKIFLNSSKPRNRAVRLGARDFVELMRNKLKDSKRDKKSNATRTAMYESIYNIMTKNPEIDFEMFYGPKESFGTVLSDTASAAIDITKNRIYLAIEKGGIGDLEDKALHEIIHGLTTSIMFRHFSGDRINRVTNEAVSRLEKLASRFASLKIDSAQLTSDQLDAVKNLQEKMQFYKSVEQNPYRKAIILSEFTAQFLTLKELVAVGKKISIPEEVKKIAKRVFEAITSLWNVKPKYDSLFEAVKFEFETIVLSAEETSASAANTLTEGIKVEGFINDPHILFDTGNLPNDTQESVRELMTKIENKIRAIAKQYTQRRYNTDVSDESNAYIGADIAKGKLVNFDERARNSLNALTAVGFTLNPVEQNLFKALHILHNFSLSDSSIVLSKLSNVFNHVAKNVSVEALGTEKFEALFKDQGEDLLPSFVALSQSSKEFRKVIRDIQLPEGVVLESNDTDGYVDYTASKIMNGLLNYLYGDPSEGAANTEQHIDNMMDSLIAIQEESAFSELAASGRFYVDKAENATIPGVHDITLAINNVAHELGLDVETVERKSITGESFVLRNLVREVIGTTKDIKPIHEMVQKVRGEVTRQRQLAIEEVHNYFNGLFGEDMTEDKARNLYEVVIRADLFAVGSDLNKVIDTVGTDASLNNRVTELESKLAALKFGRDYIAKAKQLNDFLTNGKAGINLLTNANAISRLLQEVDSIAANTEIKNNPELVSNIDELVSLYLLKGKKEALEEFRAFAKSHPKALGESFKYAQRLTEEESKKINKGKNLVTLNKTKGSAIQEKNNGQHIVIVAKDRVQELEEKGYEALLTTPDIATGERYVAMYSDSASNRPYLQGALDITNKNIASNINTLTGYEQGSHFVVDTVVANKDAARIRKSVATKRPTDQEYIPIFSEDGSVRGWQRYLNPNHLDAEARGMYNKVVTGSNMFKVMGRWKGRLIEERVGEEFNKVLIDRVIEQYDNALKSKDEKFVQDAYINIADPGLKDPVWRDAWKYKVDDNTKKYIAEKLGNANTFFIRKDLVDNVIGYQLPSLTDPFTGVSRLSEEAQRFLKATSISLFGKKAYRYLDAAENVILGLVKNTKETVIIRSVIVPFMNEASDQVHLLTRGVSFKEIYNGKPRGIAELDELHKKEQEKSRLSIRIQNATGDERTRMLSRINAIDESLKKQAIYPLVKAGHLSTIIDGLSETDRLIVGGKVGEYFEEILKSVPENVKAVGRQAFIARDTALFKGMSRVIQYSTVTSKLVYFEHLLNKGNTEEEALAIIADEFVNYDLLPGRARSFGEAYGITWFYNYKLRIIKIAASLIINHPVRAFLFSVLFPTLGVMDVGGPIMDNLVTVGFDADRVEASLGPERILRGQELNPIWQLFNLR